MTTSSAPDVDRVLDRMGRSAFGYRSFPRPDPDAGSAHEPPAAVPEAPAPAPSAALAPVRFPLIAEALPGVAVAAPPIAASVAAAAAPAPHLVPVPPAAAPPVAEEPPNPFLSRAQAAAPPVAVTCTSLAGMFRLLSGRADSARPLGDGARPCDDSGARAPAFPFRYG